MCDISLIVLSLNSNIKIALKLLTITNFVDTDTIVSDGRLASPSLCAQGAVFCTYSVKMRPSDFSSMPHI